MKHFAYVYGEIMKKIAISVVIALTSTGVFAKDWNVIRFGVDATYPPFDAKAPDGKLVGFDIDLGNAICVKLNARCQWVENAFDGMIPALAAKKFDGVLSAMSVTEKRQQQIAFSDKLYDGPSSLIAKKGAAILPTVASLKGKRVGVTQGATQETYAKTYWEPKGVTVVSYQTQELVQQDLLTGRLDASLTDLVQADLGFLKTLKGRDFAVAGDPVRDKQTLGAGVAIGLRKGDNDLRLAINKASPEEQKARRTCHRLFERLVLHSCQRSS